MTDPNDRARANNPPRRVNSSNGRDDKRGVWIAVIGALVAFCAAIAFNVRAPEGRLDGPGSGSTPTPAQGAQQTGGPPDADPARHVAPQAAESPTAPGRETVGAPVGSTPGASNQAN